jgi:hypothetical protein
MTSFIQALDKFISTHEGENRHIEFDWSKDMEEKIIQFDFHCVRTNEDGLDQLEIVLHGLLTSLQSVRDDPGAESQRQTLLTVLYKIIGKTRDIEGGKGEYMLSYMMVWIWYHYFPGLARLALALFVFSPQDMTRIDLFKDSGLEVQRNTIIPYGSWKDMKYFCNYIREKSGSDKHPLIQFCVRFINTQLWADEDAYGSQNPDTRLSLVSKWIPREASNKFGWLNEILAVDFHPQYMANAIGSSKIKAIKKCKVQYRLIFSKLNRHLDTVQIKQASNQWAEIDHSKTTSITMAKQRKAFLNQTADGDEPRYPEPDRIKCAENLKIYLESLKKKGKEVKGKNVGLEMFTKQALEVLSRNHSKNLNGEGDILNSQWRDNSNQKNANGLGPIVAMVDVSGSMTGDPICAAIALGCRVAEKSILGKRVMTFAEDPSWMNLEDCDTFTDMVWKMRNSSLSAGMSTDFYKALDLMLDSIEQANIPAEEVENMILAIFSDMQIDDNLSMGNGTGYDPNETQKLAARGKWATMYDQIQKRYADVGVRMYGKPFQPPHILFWNLRKTDGFPVLSTEANCSMMSGYDPTILNMFCEIGITALREYTPYKLLMKQLENERYLPLEQIIAYHFQCEYMYA